MFCADKFGAFFFSGSSLVLTNFVLQVQYSDLLWRSTTMSVVRNIRQHLFCPFELVASLSAGPDPKDHERGPQHLSAGQRLDGP